MNNLIQRFEKGHYTVAHKSENYTTVPKGEKLYEKRFTKVPTFDPIQEELRDFIRVLDRSDFENEGVQYLAGLAMVSSTMKNLWHT